jgi:hypothetical protein
VRSYIREKKIYCGKKYMEVDIYPYTIMQQDVHKSGKRSKKQKISAPKQKKLNDKNSRRYLIQTTKANFGEGDLHLTLTYKNKYLPKTKKEADKIVLNYLRRIKYMRKKEGAGSLKYIVVTEYATAKDNKEKIIRIHHHIIMNGGLDRDTVEDIWRMKRKKGQKKGNKIGIANATRLQPDEHGVAGLANYLSKDPRGRKRWSCSQNLDRPWSRTNDYKYSRRQIEKIAKEPPDISFWEKKYKGWKLAKDEYSIRTEFNEITSSWSIYLKLYRIE